MEWKAGVAPTERRSGEVLLELLPVLATNGLEHRPGEGTHELETSVSTRDRVRTSNLLVTVGDDSGEAGGRSNTLTRGTTGGNTLQRRVMGLVGLALLGEDVDSVDETVQRVLLIGERRLLPIERVLHRVKTLD
ncbi:unnamed protein product [Prorocentrum cordatum]|uniref:Uncharacterized protein n=1 Tax=Prorocentrum cordatum TaxID=2364126 RepID=A0ABN9S7M3_9DINO|nr:unnamed protein product [Polarella glacialis]